MGEVKDIMIDFPLWFIVTRWCYKKRAKHIPFCNSCIIRFNGYIITILVVNQLTSSASYGNRYCNVG